MSCFPKWWSLSISEFLFTWVWVLYHTVVGQTETKPLIYQFIFKPSIVMSFELCLSSPLEIWWKLGHPDASGCLLGMSNFLIWLGNASRSPMRRHKTVDCETVNAIGVIFWLLVIFFLAILLRSKISAITLVSYWNNIQSHKIIYL